MYKRLVYEMYQEFHNPLKRLPGLSWWCNLALEPFLEEGYISSLSYLPFSLLPRLLCYFNFNFFLKIIQIRFRSKQLFCEKVNTLIHLVLLPLLLLIIIQVTETCSNSTTALL